MTARRLLNTLLPLALVVGWSVTAFAQLDPLTLIKRVPPTVIIIFDTSLEMLKDNDTATGKFYDPGFYSTTADPSVMPAFSTIFNTSTTKTYRRQFSNFKYAASGSRYTADTITATAATWDPANPLTANSANDNASYFAPTRWKIARLGIAAAVTENPTLTRWGVIRLRQKNPAWRSTPGGTTTGGSDCDKPVTVSDPLQIGFGDSTPCSAGGLGNYGTYAPKVDAAAYSQTTTPTGTYVLGPSASSGAVAASTDVITLMGRQAGDPLALIPASMGFISSGVQVQDRPLSYALDDAKTAISKAITADAAATQSCRNYVVVLVTAGKDSGDSTYLTANTVTAKATSFTNITGSGNKRVPIHVVAINPDTSDVAGVTQLQAIATNSGGVFTAATSATAVQKAIDYAIQNGYARQPDLDTGKPSEFIAVSPIVGTVNLQNSAPASGGTPFTDTVIHLHGDSTAAVVPQRSNVMLTSGFEMPGFYGRLRAFRVYKPIADSTKPSGYKFVNDGTKLWPDLDGRSTLAGQARTPSDPNSRNIYTYVPDGSGGGSLVAFTAANAATLRTAMQMPSTTAASTLIGFVRSQPLGAIIGSTPAIMDPPSLDPPPDDDYGHADQTGSFAGDHFERRSMIFVGANDGMMHAIDAKTGYEVWAFIPYNLLPKLQSLYDGQSVEQFDYFVDSSPKLAEVKINNVWRSLLLFGEGPGGIFYQCFDVTDAGMNVDPSLADLSAVTSMLSKFDSPGESIQFKWAFPNYNHFDPTILRSFTLTDGTPGGKMTFYGDLNSSATYAEKTVGFTWSDPAVGPLDVARNTTAVVVGSGYFPDVETLLPNRGGASAVKAGTALYLLDVDVGTLLANDGAACPTAPSTAFGCLRVGDVSNGRKNAIQADPTAAGVSGSPVITKAYVGDIDGKYWRFNFDQTGALSAALMTDTGVPIYASSALLFVGSSDVYMFFATGSDSLPPTTAGGTGTFKLYGLKDMSPASPAATKFTIDLATVSQTGGLVTGERPSTSPTVAGDIVFYTTTTESATTPCNDFSANLYAVTYTGTAGYAPYDANANGRIDTAEKTSTLARTVGGRATAPFIVDQHLYFATSGATGANVQAFGDPEDFNNGVGQVGVRILSWREIR